MEGIIHSLIVWSIKWIGWIIGGIFSAIGVILLINWLGGKPPKK